MYHVQDLQDLQDPLKTLIKLRLQDLQDPLKTLIKLRLLQDLQDLFKTLIKLHLQDLQDLQDPLKTLIKLRLQDPQDLQDPLKTLIKLRLLQDLQDLQDPLKILIKLRLQHLLYLKGNNLPLEILDLLPLNLLHLLFLEKYQPHLEICLQATLVPKNQNLKAKVKDQLHNKDQLAPKVKDQLPNKDQLVLKDKAPKAKAPLLKRVRESALPSSQAKTSMKTSTILFKNPSWAMVLLGTSINQKSTSDSALSMSPLSIGTGRLNKSAARKNTAHLFPSGSSIKKKVSLFSPTVNSASQSPKKIARI